jgi:hypothetical protein
MSVVCLLHLSKMMPSLARAICNFSEPLDMLYKYRVDDTVIKDGLMAICKEIFKLCHK